MYDEHSCVGETLGDDGEFLQRAVVLATMYPNLLFVTLVVCCSMIDNLETITGVCCKFKSRHDENCGVESRNSSRMIAVHVKNM